MVEMKQEIGIVEVVQDSKRGTGKNYKVNGKWYFANTSDKYGFYAVGDYVLVNYEVTGKDNNFNVVHMIEPMPSENQKTLLQDETPEVLPCVQENIIAPIAPLNKIKQSWDAFQQIKKMVIDAGDIQEVDRDGEKKAYIKKSGWRKIQVAYQLRVEVLDKERMVVKQGELEIIMWNVTAKATAPNGACATAIGSCNSNERKHGLSSFAHGESDMLMTAQTRASNRAISDCVGSGEVSADEMA